MEVANLDHLGIVAGIIDEMGIVEEINTRIGRNSREKVSAGIVTNQPKKRELNKKRIAAK